MPDREPKLEAESDPEANGEGLLWVDLLSLPKTFSWRRYRVDLLGFVAAIGFVVLLMLLLTVISWVLSS